MAPSSTPPAGSSCPERRTKSRSGRRISVTTTAASRPTAKNLASKIPKYQPVLTSVPGALYIYEK
jgi:hypothetical protein